MNQLFWQLLFYAAAASALVGLVVGALVGGLYFSYAGLRDLDRLKRLHAGEIGALNAAHERAFDELASDYFKKHQRECSQFEQFMRYLRGENEQLIDRLLVRERLPAIYSDPFTDAPGTDAGRVVSHTNRVPDGHGVKHAVGPIEARRRAQIEAEETPAKTPAPDPDPEVGDVNPTLSPDDIRNLVNELDPASK
jgi:hypothetical protein